MIERLVDLIKMYGWNPGFFRIFDYITFRVIMAALTALVRGIAVRSLFHRLSLSQALP